MLSILFVGSLDEASPHFDNFLEFCQKLGAGASARHKILICGTTPRTADHSIALGAFERLGPPVVVTRDLPRITLYHTENDESQRVQDKLFERFQNADDKLSTIKPFRYETVAFQQAVEDCDIVTMIGGGTTSAALVDIAIRQQKPVLGFSAFEGSGREANLELRRVYQLLGITDAQAQILQTRQMDDQRCATYLDLVSHVHKTNPWSSKRAFKRGVRLVGILAGLALLCGGCMLSTALGLLTFKGIKFVALYISCVAAGLAGGYAAFIKQLDTPGDILLARAIPASGQGVAIGLSFAIFAQTILGFVFTQEEVISDMSFARLIVAFSGMTFAVAAFGVKGLKTIGDVLSNRPAIS